MQRTLFASFFVLASFAQYVDAQTNDSDHNSISVHPIILLQNLMPDNAAGFLLSMKPDCPVPVRFWVA